MSALASDDGALRAEHDDLARKLAARRSVDELRKAAYAAFAALIAGGFAFRLAFDRWISDRPTRFKGPPIFFWAALVAFALLAVLAGRWWARARAHGLEEDRLFARFRALRERLGLDP